MTLSLVFRIQAVIMGIFGVAALLVPAAMMSGFNVEASADSVNLVRGMSLMVVAVAYISWQMPTWAGDNLKTVGMFFAIWHVVYALLSGYQLSVGAFPSDAANLIGNLGPDVVLAILFYWKSR
ncbi:hypothetical protein OAK82_04915 [Candidatus Thioglobus sp.]|nr:hypothetical protein [Candidatus Thioglobus sp.]|tara:strand:- start:165 stop:533 length:369 start_codon:yes stop_codon:yes gene_type:complete